MVFSQTIEPQIMSSALCKKPKHICLQFMALLTLRFLKGTPKKICKVSNCYWIFYCVCARANSMKIVLKIFLWRSAATLGRVHKFPSQFPSSPQILLNSKSTKHSFTADRHRSQLDHLFHFYICQKGQASYKHAQHQGCSYNVHHFELRILCNHVLLLRQHIYLKEKKINSSCLCRASSFFKDGLSRPSPAETQHASKHDGSKKASISICASRMIFYHDYPR